MLVSRVLRSAWRASTALPNVVTSAGERSLQGLQTNFIPSVSRSISSSSQRREPNRDVVRTAALNDPKDVTEGIVNLKTIEVTFGDKSRSLYPHVWLRENCQCDQCFNRDAIARLFLVDELDLNIQPKDVELIDGGLQVTWTDGHVSPFSGEWLHQRSFNEESRQRQRSNFALQKVFWGSDFKVPEFDFHKAMADDRTLLEWLEVLEKRGVVLIKDAPVKKGPVTDFINRIGFVKPTHYGSEYELFSQVVPNNLAYTASKLGLHTDLPYVDYPPGTTWLHCIRQHEGKGGDNDLSDGFHAAQLLKERDRVLYDVLTQTPIYFQDKGHENYDFNKITKAPSIHLDEEGNVRRLNISSQSRDSLMDMDTEGVLMFYKALKALTNILYEISVRVKTKPGDILVCDNFRVLHGRTAFDPRTASGPRHLHNAYIDWSELRSKRRILQEKFGVELD